MVLRYYHAIVLHTGRRLLLILSFLSLQLSLFSGGEGCRSALAHVAGAATIAGMDMSGVDMREMDMAALHGGDRSDAPSSHHGEPRCDDEGGRASCDSMAVCPFAAVIAPSNIRHLRSLPMVRAPILALRTPPSAGDAPDLPPPRLQS